MAYSSQGRHIGQIDWQMAVRRDVISIAPRQFY